MSDGTPCPSRDPKPSGSVMPPPQPSSSINCLAIGCPSNNAMPSGSVMPPPPSPSPAPRFIIDCIHRFIQATYVNLSSTEYAAMVNDLLAKIRSGTAPMSLMHCIQSNFPNSCQTSDGLPCPSQSPLSPDVIACINATSDSTMTSVEVMIRCMNSSFIQPTYAPSDNHNEIPPFVKGCIDKFILARFNGTRPDNYEMIVMNLMERLMNKTGPPELVDCILSVMPPDCKTDEGIPCAQMITNPPQPSGGASVRPSLRPSPVTQPSKIPCPPDVIGDFCLPVPSIAPFDRCLANVVEHRVNQTGESVEFVLEGIQEQIRLGVFPPGFMECMHRLTGRLFPCRGEDDAAWCLPSVTPRPSFSSRPSLKPSPSRIPLDATPSNTRTPNPSRPPRASLQPPLPPAVSLARSPLPSSWIKPKPSKSPMPSRDPPVAGISRTPMPSPSSSPLPPPPYIPSRVEFPGANATLLAQPEKIQELQASLACTLLMPLDKLYINNITRISGGVKEVVPVDPTRYRLTGNTTECMVKTARRLLRANRFLQATTDTVLIDYTVLDPPQELVDLTSDDLTTILASSDVVTSVAASVGGTSIVASSEIDMIAQDAPQPSPTPVPSKSVFQEIKDKISQYVLGGGLGGGAVVIALAAGLFLWRRHVKAKKRQTVTMTHFTNPIAHARPAQRQADILYLDDNAERSITSPRIVVFQEDNRVAIAPLQANRV